ncbi:hypothetical protein JMM63_12345 [Rhodovulum sulfidophilum]|uniref:hypothetical protein n=1 Tax=Rhodovulum sulfidophilum TaxID=35806 RepID=UPI00192356BA|nr:hypothetical protein [Rhodovulum sulfidophilum]MBL3596353.1 hypothetical protein [Rhodovulum sulfidophilum]
MADFKQRMSPEDGAKAVEKLAADALAGFKADAKKEYAELVKQYEGASATVGVFGMGSVEVSVLSGEVHINPGAKRMGEQRGVGAISPEALVAISEGKMTVLDAFHRGEIVVRAGSEALHEGYDSFLKNSEAALKSNRLQKTLAEFRKMADV